MARANVVVGVGGAVVVHVEQAVVQVLVIVTTNVQTGVRRVEVPVIGFLFFFAKSEEIILFS